MGNAVSQYDQVYTVKSRNFNQFKNKNFQQKRAHKTCFLFCYPTYFDAKRI